MMKLMDRTNIDFIGPRYICMVLSTIDIPLGLGVLFVRRPPGGAGEVQHRLHRGDPGDHPPEHDDAELQALAESQRVDFVRRDGRASCPT